MGDKVFDINNCNNEDETATVDDLSENTHEQKQQDDNDVSEIISAKSLMQTNTVQVPLGISSALHKVATKPIVGIDKATLLGNTATNLNSKVTKVNGLSGIVSGLDVYKNAFASKVKLDLPTWSAKFVDFSKYLPKYNLAVNSLSRLITEAIVKPLNFQINSIFSGLSIPKVSEKRKEELRTIHEKWGKYGWTMMPHHSISQFYNDPISYENSNKVASQMCTKNDMMILFEELHNVKGVSVADINEAIFCYENKKYKSCAMILFALLDAKLIRLQTKEDRRQSTNTRFTGGAAAGKLKKRIKKEHDIEKKFIMLLSYTNLFSCINVMFENTDDFKKKTKVINRNYLQHGMLTRKVRKRDCIQLFLVYFNLLEFLEVFHTK